jgi:hypothetical protein
MVHTGQKLYVYWGWTTTFKGGNPYTTISQIAGSHAHIPFNPITDVPIPKVKTVYEMKATAQTLYPNIQWTKIKEGEEVTITSYYRDPFLWTQFMSDVTISTSWVMAGSKANEIIGTLGDRSEEGYMWMQVHIHDKDAANHHDLFFDGGQITKYKITFEAGQPVKEELTILFAEVNEEVNPCAIAPIDGIDDGSFDRTGIYGGWANWDQYFDSSEKVLHTSDLTIQWGGAAIDDIAIVSGSIEFSRKHKHLQLADSYTAGLTFEETNETPYQMEVTGYLENKQNYSEFLAEIASKTTGTAKILYNTNCFWQFTNAVIKDYDIKNVKADAVEVSIMLEGSAGSVPSMQWANDGTITVDPSALILHTNP